MNESGLAKWIVFRPPANSEERIHNAADPTKRQAKYTATTSKSSQALGQAQPVRYSTQPLRYSRRTNLLASGRLVTRIFLASHSIFLPVRNATKPSSIASVIGPA